MSYQPKNPFENKDWFSELISIDCDAKSSLKSSLYVFQTQYDQQSITQLQKIITFFATHTITAILTASICLGGIAAFAAQTTAPEQYKPSTVLTNLFKNNVAQKEDPTVPLIQPNQSGLINFEECGLSLKVPKSINGKEIVAVRDSEFQQFNPMQLINERKPIETDKIEYVTVDTDQQILDDLANNYTKDKIQSIGFSILERSEFERTNRIATGTATKADETAEDLVPFLNSISIECNYGNENEKGTFRINNNDDLTPYSKEEIAKDTGWFISSDIEKGYIDKDIPNFEFMDLKKHMQFRRNGINYEIGFSKDNKKRKRGIFGNQIQIQFNDLVGLEVKKIKEVEEPKVDNSKFISKSGVVLQSKLISSEWFFEDIDTKQIYKFDL